MSLNKAIEHGKEFRKPYGREYGTYAKAVCALCRNHGGCIWCLGNRMYKNNRKERAAMMDLKEWMRRGGDTVAVYQTGSIAGGETDGSSHLAAHK